MSSAVRTLADRVFDRSVDVSWYVRTQRGLPVESIRVESPQAWAEDTALRWRARRFRRGLGGVRVRPRLGDGPVRRSARRLRLTGPRTLHGVAAVVDTGLNLYGWSREQAAAYMKAHTTVSDAQVASELVRYGTDLPGQALAYRALRRADASTRGGRTDPGQQVRRAGLPRRGSRTGGLPFPVLDGHLERWAAGTGEDR